MARNAKKLFTTILTPALLLTLSITVYAARSDDLFEDDIENVLTPTRLQQQLRDVPASVTVVTRDMIQRLNLRTVPDALRFVPGMIVGQASGNEYRINYHGTNGLVPRRMQVLIDGVSIYHTGFAEVTWSALPVSIDDIERIEVTRSPSAATYGANSFMAVINIITRHTSDTQGAVIKASAGSLGTKDIYASLGNKVGDTSFRFSYSHQQDNGFDYNATGNERRDGTLQNRLNFKSSTELDMRTSLDLEAAYVNAALQSEYADSRQLTYPDKQTENAYISGVWSRHFDTNHLQIKAYERRDYTERKWRSCYPTIMLSPELRALDAANQSYVATLLKGSMPSGGTSNDNLLLAAVLTRITQLGASALAPMCGDTGEDQLEHQMDFEIQDTWVVSDTLRTVMGAGLRRDSYESVTFVNGKTQYNSSRLFGTAEYKPTDKVTLNLGGMLENSAGHTEGTDFSPRTAINYHFNTNNTLRLIYSRSTRTPDALETNRDWNYYATNLSPLYNGSSTGVFYHNARADRALVPEKITSREVGYYFTVPQLDLAGDIKVYQDSMTDLISEKPQFFDYHPTNTGSAELRGGELQLEFKPSRRISTWLTYAYIDNQSPIFYERSLNARHSGSAVVSYSMPDNLGLSIAYFGNSAMGGLTSYGSTNLVLSKGVVAGKQRLDGVITLSRLNTTRNSFVVNQTVFVENNYNDRYHLYASLKLSVF